MEQNVDERLQKAADECYYRNHAFARESFIEGANWQKKDAIKSLWHDASEEPTSDKDILFTSSLDKDCKLGRYEEGEFRAYSEIEEMQMEIESYYTIYKKDKVEQWCYVEDLLK